MLGQGKPFSQEPLDNVNWIRLGGGAQSWVGREVREDMGGVG